MRAWIDQAMADEVAQRDGSVDGLADWGVVVDPEIGFEWYQVWKMSGYVMLPYPGGWMAQPWYVRKTLYHFMKVERWHRQQGGRPAKESLPTFGAVFGSKE